VAHHSALGLRVGLTREAIAGLENYEAHPTYSELERLVIRYAEELTTKVHVDEKLHKELRTYLSDHELAELCVAVATANFTNRITHALSLDLERGGHTGEHDPS